MIKIITILGLGVLVLSILGGLFKKPEVTEAVLFSAVDGRVVKGGEPQAGATLIREWEFSEVGVTGRDETIVDEQGRFSFPIVKIPYRRSRFLAQEIVISQLIRVQLNEEEWRVWAGSKRNFRAGTEFADFGEAGESNEVPLRVVVDLDSPQELRGHVVGHTIAE